MAGVQLKNIHKAYGNVKVVKGLNLELKNGEFISLLGPSGCGKTTTLRMVAGLERPTSGEIFIGERCVYNSGVFIPPEKRNLGMVFQSYAVWPHMNVFDNVGYPLKIRKVKKSIIAEKVNHALGLVKMEELGNRMPNQLSGGQQQRVALARALVMEPDVLLLDEPLSNLDAKLRDDMRVEIKELQKRLGISVLYVTHDQAEAMVMSDKIAVMNKGVIEQFDVPANIYGAPATAFVADFIGSINLIPVKVNAEETGQIVSIGGQKIKIPSGKTQSLDGPQTLAIRPEEIHLLPEGEGPLSGSIVGQYFYGDHREYHIEIGNQVMKVLTDPSQQFAKGKTVGMDLGNMHFFS